VDWNKVINGLNELIKKYAWIMMFILFFILLFDIKGYLNIFFDFLFIQFDIKYYNLFI
jgi:hypothetical protein